jgi:molybdenum cofactor cytidylyltransferase
VRAQKRHSSEHLWCVVLAAGGSSRLGRPKQLVRHARRPLLLNAVAAAAGVAPGRTVVVLGAGALRLRLMLRRCSEAPIRVHNKRWPEGIASSLREGLAALPGNARAVLILLADQPRIRARVLARLVHAWRARPARAAAAAYGGGFGVPAILPRRLWRRAARLRGDAGARALLAAEHTLTLVPLPEAELDVDTEDDLLKLQRLRGYPDRA